MEFIKALVAFFAANGVLPAEVTPSDTNREKTYLQNLPDAPTKAYCVRIYDADVPSLVDKQAGVYRVQVLMRNKNHAAVMADMYKLWRFLLNRPELVEDISEEYWAIFDVRTGPNPLGQDEKGNYLYSLNIPIKTKMF